MPREKIGIIEKNTKGQFVVKNLGGGPIVGVYESAKEARARNPGLVLSVQLSPKDNTVGHTKDSRNKWGHSWR